MRTGEKAPDVALKDQEGVVRTLRELANGRRCVLFFYPAAMTSGCTKESCHFRDLKKEFDAVQAVRVGISMDTVDKQARFASTNGLDYPLLSDPDGAVAHVFGVKRPLDFLKVKRTTFVLDEDLTVLDVISSELKMETHADRALATLTSISPRGATSS
jgi:peroxiredoxin Q/BCP